MPSVGVIAFNYNFTWMPEWAKLQPVTALQPKPAVLLPSAAALHFTATAAHPWFRLVVVPCPKFCVLLTQPTPHNEGESSEILFIKPEQSSYSMYIAFHYLQY